MTGSFWELIKRKRFTIAFLAIIFAALACVTLVRLNYYPVAIIGNHVIGARQFMKDYAAVEAYYENALRTYAAATSTAPLQKPTGKDIEAHVLNQLVEMVLVGDGAKKEAGGDLDSLVKGKLSPYDADSAFQHSAEVLYGLPFSDFKAEVLVPQAERDILKGRLFLKGEKFDDWLVSAKRSARVIIFSPAFYWDGEKVVGK